MDSCDRLVPSPGEQPLNVAIADHDEAHCVLLDDWLRCAGHRVQRFSRGELLLYALRQTHSYDAFVLAWELPDVAAIDVLRVVRNKLGMNVPVLVTSSCDREEDIFYVLSRGADDFLIRPIRRGEFIARLEAITRRHGGSARRNTQRIGDYHIDPVGHQVFHHGRISRLTRIEFDLAMLLLSSAGRLLSHTEVLACIWGDASYVRLHTLQSYVSRLRNTLGLTPTNGWRIVCVYGHGYRVQKLDAAAPAPEDDSKTARKLAPAMSTTQR